MPRYATTYDRLLANSAQSDPDNPQSCWLWTGSLSTRGYPQMSRRVAGKIVARRAHRVMLEEILGCTFPHDEAGHLCYDRRCIHPDHLEVQTRAFNLSERRGYAETDGCMIPILIPRVDRLQVAADRAWDGRGEVGGACPF